MNEDDEEEVKELQNHHKSFILIACFTVYLFCLIIIYIYIGGSLNSRISDDFFLYEFVFFME